MPQTKKKAFICHKQVDMFKYEPLSDWTARGMAAARSTEEGQRPAHLPHQVHVMLNQSINTMLQLIGIY